MEFVRHRVFSFVQESTRYCNYSKEKFGNELTFIVPSWLDLENNLIVRNTKVIEQYSEWVEYFGEVIAEYFWTLSCSESSYLRLLEKGWVAQQARSVLPNSLKTELIMTGTVSQWQGFFKLRCAESAHPQARELAIPLYRNFIERGYIDA